MFSLHSFFDQRRGNRESRQMTAAEAQRGGAATKEDGGLRMENKDGAGAVRT
jgi:hypothetical protein